MDVREFLAQVRRELEPVNQYIINHPIIRDAEVGTLSISAIKAFVINQWYIVNSDARSIAMAMARTKAMDELILMRTFLDGDYNALMELTKLMRELNIEAIDPLSMNVIPEAVSYTHYLSWLAINTEPGEFAFALVINLPVWGAMVSKIDETLKAKYGIKNTGFFELFSGHYNELEEEALPVVERYMGDGSRMRNIAVTIQNYERSFWDAIHRVST
ncbi:MAG: TenA family transcriptional regulator [Vulcanisaeta sp. AZ3]|jgi:thiaminase